MWKKIAVFFLVLLIIAGAAGLMVKDKLEKQFEQFMVNEIEKKAAEEMKNLEAQLSVPEASVDDQVKENKENETEEIAEAEGEIKAEVQPEAAKVVETAEEAEKNSGDEAKTEEENEDAIVSDETSAEVPKEESSDLTAPPVAIPEDVSEEEYQSDKAKAISLALKRLSLEQLKRLMEISKDGFTAEEKAEAKEMFYGNFTKEEQEWILGIYESYYLKK